MPHSAVDAALDRAEDAVARRLAAAPHLRHVAAEQRRDGEDEPEEDEKLDPACGSHYSFSGNTRAYTRYAVSSDREDQAERVVVTHAATCSLGVSSSTLLDRVGADDAVARDRQQPGQHEEHDREGDEGNVVVHGSSRGIDARTSGAHAMSAVTHADGSPLDASVTRPARS